MNKITASTVAAEPSFMKGTAEDSLVLGVTSDAANFVNSVSELASNTVLAFPTFGE